MAQEYEKVLYPFIIQGKKRYVGNLYEKNVNEFKQKSMGIELKRRDNAPIVKIMSAGVINKILNERSSKGAYNYVKTTLDKIISGQFNIDKFIVTKTLKGNALTYKERIEDEKKDKSKRHYKNRNTIVHAVLADRMADRDPGNKPLSNDRIPYVYIELNYEPELQGERVETPEYVLTNNLKLDYLFYITNQIQKPILKFLDLIIENSNNVFIKYIIPIEENRKNNVKPLIFDSDNDNLKNIKLFDDDNIIKVNKDIKSSNKKPKAKTTKVESKSQSVIDITTIKKNSLDKFMENF
jgi:DNA polymerase elongation subunit (family B)